jgi:hypothetical protein
MSTFTTVCIFIMAITNTLSLALLIKKWLRGK